MALYRTGGANGPKVAVGTFSTANSIVDVNIGFKPKYLSVVTFKSNGTTPSVSHQYNEDISTTQYLHTAGDVYLGKRNLNASTTYNLRSINDDGFSVNAFPSSDWRGNAYYFAIG